MGKKPKEPALRVGEARAEETGNEVPPSTGVSSGSRNERPYVSIQQLSQLVPWSASSIRTMMSRGKLVQGEHFYRPFGPGSHPIFRWASIVNLIEGTKSCATRDDKIFLANGGVVELGEDDR